MASAIAAGPVQRLVASLVGRSKPALLWLTVAMLFAVSGGMLWYAGINYDGLTGGAASKIHPSTYLAVLAFGWILLTSPNLIGAFVDMANKRPASTVLLATTTFFFAYVILRRAPGMAGVIDTFVPAALMVMLLSRTDDDTMRRLEILIHAIMAVNALMGLYEFVTGNIIAPFRLDGQFSPYDTRSTALQGHPLISATVTAIYVLILMTRGGPALGDRGRLVMLLLQGAALVTFGGRSAMVSVVMFGSVIGLISAGKILRRGRLGLATAAMIVVGLTCVPLALLGLAQIGFFDALLSRFESDGGSANARILMFDIFSALSWQDLLVGPDAGVVDTVRRLNGLELGIENPIVKTLLYQGLIITVLQTLAVTMFFFELGRLAGRRAFLPMLAFIALINTFESIGGKTTLLTKFAVMIVCLYRPVAQAKVAQFLESPRASRMSGSNRRLPSTVSAKPSNRFQNAQAIPNSSPVRRTSAM